MQHNVKTTDRSVHYERGFSAHFRLLLHKCPWTWCLSIISLCLQQMSLVA